MPVPFVKDQAKKHHESIQTTEQAWDRAKEIVKKEYGSANKHWGVVTEIFKKEESSKK